MYCFSSCICFLRENPFSPESWKNWVICVNPAEKIEQTGLYYKLIIGSAQSQPQGLKNVFNRVESYSAGLFTYESTYDNRIFRQIDSQNFYGSGSETLHTTHKFSSLLACRSNSRCTWRLDHKHRWRSRRRRCLRRKLLRVLFKSRDKSTSLSGY